MMPELILLFITILPAGNGVDMASDWFDDLYLDCIGNLCTVFEVDYYRNHGCNDIDPYCTAEIGGFENAFLIYSSNSDTGEIFILCSTYKHDENSNGISEKTGQTCYPEFSDGTEVITSSDTETESSINSDDDSQTDACDKYNCNGTGSTISDDTIQCKPYDILERTLTEAMKCNYI